MWSKMKFGNQQKHLDIGVRFEDHLRLKAFRKAMAIPEQFNGSWAVTEPIGMFLNGPNTYAKDNPGDPVAQLIPAAGLGICTKASHCGWIKCIHWAAGRPWHGPSDKQCLDSYIGCDGYVPGNDKTDQGGTLLGTEQYFESPGIAGNILRATALVDWHDPEMLKTAMVLGNGLDAGLALPKAVLSSEVWDVGDPSLSGDWAPQYGHDTILMAYNYDYPGMASNNFKMKGRYDFGVMTWDQGGQVNPLIPATNAFVQAYYNEMRIMFAHGMDKVGGGVLVADFVDFASLIAAMAQVEYPDPGPSNGDEA